MTSKRGATKELTHDNWAEEDEPEEMGTFRQASTQQLATRQIKKARRRGMVETSPTPGVFKGLTPFSGFASNKDTSSQPTFSFLSKDTSGDSVAKPTFNIFSSPNSNTTANTAKLELNSTGKKTLTQPLKLSQESVSVSPKVSDSVKSNGLGPSKSNTESGGKSGSKQFLAHLKALNEGVLSWVKEHLDKNPHVNLSPVFDDYKKHFEELTKKYPPSFGNESDTDMKNADTKKDEASEKENKPIVEEEASRESTVTPTFSFTAASSAATKSSETKTFVSFGTDSKAAESKEGTKDSSEKPKFSFGGFGNSKSSEGLMFGDGGKTSGKGFTFGGLSSTQSSTTGFTFSSSSTSVPAGKDSGQGASADEPTDEPPVVEVTEVKEDDALYEKKCKLYYMKDGAYVEKGVGTLFLKPAGEKTQLVVRALTNLGNILLNIILNASVPTIRVGKNGVMIACIPNPPLDGKDPSKEPIKMLIRVKTLEDADLLLEKINEYKK